MSRKGYYIGGHTVIGPQSGWFSLGTSGKKISGKKTSGKKTSGKKKRLRQAARVAETERSKHVKEQKAAKATATKTATRLRKAVRIAETERPKHVKEQDAGKAAAAKIATQKMWQDWETDLEHKLQEMMDGLRLNSSN